jgi:hypothetical protein
MQCVKFITGDRGVDCSNEMATEMKGIGTMMISIDFNLLYIYTLHDKKSGVIPYQRQIYSFFYLVYEATGTAATSALLCQPRVIMKMIVEK